MSTEASSLAAAKAGEGSSTAVCSKRKWWAGYALLVAGLIAVTAVLSCLDARKVETWLAENGPVEMLSAAGYVVCAASLVRVSGGVAGRHWDAQLILIAMALRELDFHARFTTMNITKIRFFTSSSVPWGEKVAGGLLAAVLLAAAASFFRKHARTAWRGLRTGSVAVWGVVLGVALAISTKLVDGLPRKLEGLGQDIPGWMLRAVTVAEEVFELGIPLMFAAAILSLSGEPGGRRSAGRG